MAGLQLSGLASGLDWQSLVDKLIAVQQAPVTALQNKQSTGANQIYALNSIQTKLTELQTSIKAMGTSNLFAGRSANIAAANSGWSATAAAGMETGQYTFDVTQLATKTQLMGTANLSKPLSDAGDGSDVTLATMGTSTAVSFGVTAADGSKSGDFTVNGVKISIAPTDSLKDVLDRITAQTGVTASYDQATDKVSLSSASPIILGSANDTSNFLTALKLYNNNNAPATDPGVNLVSQTPLASVLTNPPISDARLAAAVASVPPGITTGSVMINGVSIPFDLSKDSIQSLINKINLSTAGVSAGYDQTQGRFSLTNKVTGDSGITIGEDPADPQAAAHLGSQLLNALGLTAPGATTKLGVNASVSINGGPAIVSSSNVLDSSVTGIKGLSVTVNSKTTQTINVASDTKGSSDQIDDFIAKYNAVQSYIEEQTKITSGSKGKVATATLSANREVSDMASKLRSIVFGSVPGLSGTITRLEGMGIDFKSGTSQLQVKDKAKLTDALNYHADEVSTLFNSASTGLVSQIDTFIKNVTGTGGSLTVQVDSLNKRSKDMDDQIARLTAQIAADKARLTASFVAMEQAQSNIQTQLAALQNAFGEKSSSKS